MAQLLCAPQLKLVLLRATRLAEDCTYVTGAGNSVVTTAGIRFNVDPEIEAGEEFTQRNGDGDICLNFKDDDQLKYLNAEMELCVRDAELVELLTGEPLALNSGGDTVGGGRTVGAINHPGALLEIWVRTGSASSGVCAAAGQQFARYIYPKATFILGANTWENGLNNLTLTGRVDANPNALDGPFSDIGASVEGDIPANVAEWWFYEQGTLPTPECGYSTTDVPATANDPTPP